MRKIINSITIFISLNSFTQNDTTIITSREKVPLQAVMEIESSKVLYAGQEYTCSITTSGEFNISLSVENAKINLIEKSKKSTGGLRYSFTPIDTGVCSIAIGNLTDKERPISLSMYTYKVIKYPVPPIQINGFESSQIINKLKDSTVLKCAYPVEKGIFEEYEIKSWSAVVNDKTFLGNGDVLSEELIQYINQSNKAFLHLHVVLFDNKTKHLSSDAIYLVETNE